MNNEQVHIQSQFGVKGVHVCFFFFSCTPQTLIGVASYRLISAFLIFLY